MHSTKGLARFLEAQNHTYLKALSEIESGTKSSHWMWYIFPQLKGLGTSANAQFFAIHDLHEAREYLEHPVLGRHLVEMSTALLQIEGKSAHEILGSPDDLKLRSSMTLFHQAQNSHPVFEAVLNKYFNGVHDNKTLELIQANLQESHTGLQ